jgi:hypothetical protein
MFEILKRKAAALEFEAQGGTITAGRLVGYEVRWRKDDSLVRKHDCNQRNWMFQRLGNRICHNWSASTWYTIEGEFSACQIGTSDTANSENITNVVSPITGIGRSTSIYLSSNQSYNFSRFDIITPAVYGSDTVDGDYRIKYRVSHQHTALPSNAPSSVIIKEITYTNAASPATTGGGPYSGQLINSRVVLTTPNQIELQPDQYVITIYEWEYRLPSFREIAFADTDINISGLVPFSGDKAGSVRLTGALPANGAQFARDTYIYMPWRTAMSSMVSSGGGSLASGYGIDGASRLGVSRENAFLQIGAGKANWASNVDSIRTGTNDMYVDVSATNPGGYQYDLIRTQTFTRPRRAEGVVLEDMDNVRSIFVFWYQFLFDNTWSLYSDQEFTVTARLKWNILNAL